MKKTIVAGLSASALVLGSCSASISVTKSTGRPGELDEIAKKGENIDLSIDISDAFNHSECKITKYSCDASGQVIYLKCPTGGQIEYEDIGNDLILDKMTITSPAYQTWPGTEIKFNSFAVEKPALDALFEGIPQKEFIEYLKLIEDAKIEKDMDDKLNKMLEKSLGESK